MTAFLCGSCTTGDVLIVIAGLLAVAGWTWLLFSFPRMDP